MITTENKYFLRIILLLYDAASFILRHIVVRELEKRGDDVDNLLRKDEFENKLKHQLHFGKSQVEKLFPSNGRSDIQTWDSQMLAVVGKLIFRSTLSRDEKFYINYIKHTRNTVAHKQSASYSEDDFVDEKEGIIKAITILASSFDSTVQENCRKLISSYCSDPFDHLDKCSHVQLAIKHLEEETNNGELLRQILDAIKEKHEIVRKDIEEHAVKIENKINLTEKKICETQETVLNSLNGLCLNIGNVESQVTASKEKSSQELKKCHASLTRHIVKETEKVSQKVDTNSSFLLQELQRDQNEHAAKLESKLEELKQLFEQTSRTEGHCTKQIKFGTHTHLTVDGPTQEWINTVETVLKNVFDILLNNVQEPGQNPETERAVKEFLNYIKGFKGVELKSVERKCILLAFECSTYSSLTELIEFINSNGFLSYLESIARALEKDLKIPQKLVISSEIPISSLQLVFDDKSSSINPESKKGIALLFECTSIDGLDAFWRLFVKGEATPYIDNIAATVSSEIGEKTSLSTTVNLQEFEDALTNLEATVNKEKETKPLKPNRETTHQSSDLELDIDTIQTRKDLELRVEENHDELIKPDPLLSVYTSIQDTKSDDLIKHSEISGHSDQRFNEQKYQCGIESEGKLYSSEQSLTEPEKISSSHQKYCISLVFQEESHLHYGINANPTIYSCAVLSHERLMIADNDGLSVVNTHTGLVEQMKSLNTMQSDIAVLPGDQVAVALPWDDKVMILSTTDMSLIRSIPDVYHPSGITYHQNKLFLVCGRRKCVYILNLFGDFLENIECDELLIYPCTKIAVSMNAQNLYLSYYKSLIKYSARGRVIARYSFTESEPKALTLLNDGSLVVVSTRINCIDTIHHISADLRQGYELNLGNALFIGVDPVNSQIYAIYKKVIHVYNMQKQSSQRQSDKKLTSATADEMVSSFKAGLSFPSREADKDVTSLKAGKKLLSNMSNETNEKFASITEMKLPSLKTDEEFTLFKAGTRFPARKSDKESASFKSRLRIHSPQTDENSASFKARTRPRSRETDEESASFKASMRSPLEADKESGFFSFPLETSEKSCQLM